MLLPCATVLLVLAAAPAESDVPLAPETLQVPAMTSPTRPAAISDKRNGLIVAGAVLVASTYAISAGFGLLAGALARIGPAEKQDDMAPFRLMVIPLFGPAAGAVTLAGASGDRLTANEKQTIAVMLADSAIQCAGAAMVIVGVRKHFEEEQPQAQTAHEWAVSPMALGGGGGIRLARAL